MPYPCRVSCIRIDLILASASDCTVPNTRLPASAVLMSVRVLQLSATSIRTKKRKRVKFALKYDQTNKKIRLFQLNLYSAS
jgi:hypothetical protein